MFQNFVIDVLNRVDGQAVANGTAKVIARSGVGEICRVNTMNSTGYSAVEIQLDPNKNSMVTFDLTVSMSAEDSSDVFAIAAIVPDFGQSTYAMAGKIQTVIPVELSQFGSHGAVRVKGAVNVPKIGPSASSAYSCIIAINAKGFLTGIARAHYADFHTFQPNK